MKLRANKMRYGQDFSQHRGIPAGVDFQVERFAAANRGVMFKLVGFGYGELDVRNQYGNGALYVWGLTARQLQRFQAAIKKEK